MLDRSLYLVLISVEPWEGYVAMRASIALVLSLLSFLALSPDAAFAQPACVPGDLWRNECTLVEGTELHMHACGIYACYKFFRRVCGSSTWTLIYEGKSNVYCDTQYILGDCVQYKGQRWTGSCSGSQGCETQIDPVNCPGGCSLPLFPRRKCTVGLFPERVSWHPET
jgi:hypothetical protein